MCRPDSYLNLKKTKVMSTEGIEEFELDGENVEIVWDFVFLGAKIEDSGTVEPLTNDHPHQRPSLSYDHISCDGQWFLFVYESLTSDHPSYTTTPM